MWNLCMDTIYHIFALLRYAMHINNSFLLTLLCEWIFHMFLWEKFECLNGSFMWIFFFFISLLYIKKEDFFLKKIYNSVENWEFFLVNFILKVNSQRFQSSSSLSTLLFALHSNNIKLNHPLQFWCKFTCAFIAACARV